MTDKQFMTCTLLEHYLRSRGFNPSSVQAEWANLFVLGPPRVRGNSLACARMVCAYDDPHALADAYYGELGAVLEEFVRGKHALAAMALHNLELAMTATVIDKDTGEEKPDWSQRPWATREALKVAGEYAPVKQDIKVRHLDDELASSQETFLKQFHSRETCKQ